VATGRQVVAILLRVVAVMAVLLQVVEAVAMAGLQVADLRPVVVDLVDRRPVVDTADLPVVRLLPVDLVDRLVLALVLPVDSLRPAVP
jgi:hypothetical protein